MASPISLASSFPVYRTTANPADEAYRKNVDDWQRILQKFEDNLAWAAGEGESRHIEYVKWHPPMPP